MTIFPNFSFWGVSVSNISEERTFIFSVSNFPKEYSLLNYGHDFSVFIKSGHALDCFFQYCLFPFGSIQEKMGK